MSFLRSSIIVAIISLFVFTGYAADVLDYTCDGERQEQAAKSKPLPGKTAPVGNDGCQCLCHQIFATDVVEPIRVGSANVEVSDFLLPRDEFPPDAMPRGIDYPPQLA